MKSVNFIRRTEGGKIKNLYLTTDGVRNFVMSNDKSVKVRHVTSLIPFAHHDYLYFYVVVRLLTLV